MRIIIVLAALLVCAAPVLAKPDALPNSDLTPGVSRDLTLKQICDTKWGKDARAVTEAMKRQVMDAYQVHPKDCPSGKLEIDHLVSRELGGADDVKNLWPQCYEKPVKGLKPSQTPEWGAHKKDRLENFLHKQVCAGRLTLKAAQGAIRSDWVEIYKHYYGDPK